jgi:hypothetical protein
MAGAAGGLRAWWERLRTRDPYWDAFLHRPPADPKNVITEAMLPGPTGSVFPTQTEIHDTAAMSGHLKEFAKFVGADATGVSAVKADQAADEAGPAYPFAVSCLVEAVEEVKVGTGVGGQFAVQKCAMVNFNLAAYIRELGYDAVVEEDGAHAYAAAAGLGRLDPDGKLVTPKFGRRVGISGVILTDILLAPDPPLS